MHCRLVDLTKEDEKSFECRFVGCIILTKDNKIMLQQRGVDWNNYPGYLAEFGGRIEINEEPIQALIRKLHEELGAQVKERDVISLGAITEQMTEHTELIHVYFWHDKLGTISGCYEGEAKYFNTVETILKLQHVKMTDGLRWLLCVCEKRNLL
jgi:8-oxo-dGTP diphosphatase